METLFPEMFPCLRAHATFVAEETFFLVCLARKQNMQHVFLVEKRQIRVLFDHLLILSHGCRPHWENRTSFLSHIGVAPSGSIADKNQQKLIQTSHFVSRHFVS